MKKITIAELATKAEVSTATVRRYLKNEKVRSDLEEKIKKAIEITGYMVEETKNHVEKVKENAQEYVEDIVEAVEQANAKSDERKKGKDLSKGYTFGILTRDVTNPRARKIVKALQDVCYHSDCLFAVCITEGNKTLEERYIAYMIKQGVDAVIVESCSDAPAIAHMLDKAGVRGVFLSDTGKGLNSLAVDEKAAGATLGNYLIDHHHLIIRYLGADEALTRDHFEGIQNTYHQKRQPLDFAMKMCNGSHLDVYEKIKEIFSEKIDVLILERDEMAIPLNKYLKEYHIAVPQNASVISFGGHAITKVMSPTLTSLAFDYKMYATYICNTLFAMMEGKTKPKLPAIYKIQEGDSVR